MVKKIQDVDMDWQGLQARLDHYNKWLMDPSRPFTSIYPGYTNTNKTDSYSAQVDSTGEDNTVAKGTVKKSKKINKLAHRNETVDLDSGASIMDVSVEKTHTERISQMAKVTNLSRATEIVKASASKAEALEKIVAELNVSRSNAFVYFTKASKALVGDAYPNLKAEKAPKVSKAVKVNPVTETSPQKAKAKLAEIDKVIAGLKASGATVSPFAGLGA